jgi:glycine cleavage system H lipoate-binding protein
VILVVLGTLTLAMRRVLSAFQQHRNAAIAWHVNFEDLPRDERACRHAITGELPGRICDRAFDCNGCANHQSNFAASMPTLWPGVVDDSLGFVVPLDRYYHRAHVWAHPEADGTFTLGLDEIARRVATHPQSIELPAPGTRLSAEGSAWTIRVGGTDIAVKAPFDCTVVETSLQNQGWVMRVQPAPGARFDHLLRGAEVPRWLLRELDRLQLLLSASVALPALADGGVPVDDLPAACPQADWANITAALFLEN